MSHRLGIQFFVAHLRLQVGRDKEVKGQHRAAEFAVLLCTPLASNSGPSSPFLSWGWMWENKTEGEAIIIIIENIIVLLHTTSQYTGT